MDSTDYICSVCLENARHAKNKIQEGRLRCYCCNLNLPIDNYRKHHKKCKQCEQVAHLLWQRENAHLWKKSGKYYNYVKKKDRQQPQEELNIDEAQIASLSGSLQN